MARGYKTFSMLNSAGNGILNAHKPEKADFFIFLYGIKIYKNQPFQAQKSLECYFSCSLMLKCQQLLIF